MLESDTETRFGAARDRFGLWGQLASNLGKTVMGREYTVREYTVINEIDDN